VLLGLVALYVAADRSTIALQILPDISAWYPPAALSVAALLGIGLWCYPVLCLAASLSLYVNYRLEPSIWNITTVMVSTGIYAVVTWGLRDSVHLDLRFRRLRDVAWFILLILPAAGLVAAVAVAMFFASGQMPWQLYPRAVFNWAVGDGAAFVSITPFLLQFVFPWVRKFLGREEPAVPGPIAARAPKLSGWEYLEIAGQVISVPLILWLVFGINDGKLLYVCFIPVIWVAVRHGLRGTTLVLVAINTGAVAAFRYLHPALATLTDLQCLMLVLAVTGLALGALIEERKIGEQALRDAEMRFRALVEQSLVGIYMLEGPEARITYVNPKAAAIFGYTPGEIVGMRAMDVAIDEDKAAITENVRRRVAGEESSIRYTYRGRHKNGEIREVEVHGLMTEFAGRPAILGVLVDVTQRKRAEHALRQAEEKYREIFDHAVVGIFQTTPDGRYLSANTALARMYGFDSPEELIATNTDIAKQEYVDPTRREEYKRILDEKGVVRDFVIEIYRKDGSHGWVLENARAVRDPEGRVIYYEGTQQDITERKHLEAQYEQAQKMEAVGRLAGGIAHDFNNILGVILGYTEISQNHLEESNPVTQHMARIKQAADRAAILTRQLLAFSSKQVVFPRVLDMNKVVRNLTDMLRPLVGEDVTISFEPGVDLWRIKADPGQIEQILMNLGVNSRDAMPSGGRIMVETKNVTLDQMYAQEHSPVMPGPYVMLSFTDTGCGIAPENLERIFEPFFTTKSPGKGTGLGLATVYGIVKQNNGFIWVYSEPDRGTVFKIYFPRVEEKESITVETEAEAASEGGSETILVVEDEDALRSAAVMLLQSDGYNVLKADGAATAVTLAQNYPGKIDLVLTDVIMPSMSGVELGEQLKKLRPGIRVLYMSGYAGDQLGAYGQFASDAGLLEKPFTRKSLLKKVRAALDIKSQSSWA